MVAKKRPNNLCEVDPTLAVPRVVPAISCLAIPILPLMNSLILHIVSYRLRLFEEENKEINL